MPKCKKVYIYRDSHLPEKGWIQSCFHCYTYTSNTIDFTYIIKKQIMYQIDIYLCEHCELMLNNSEHVEKRQIFEEKCNKYIKNMFD